MTTVSSGTTLIVSSGQTLDGVIVLNGGLLQVQSGGTILNTLNLAGIDEIFSGGSAINTAVTGTVTPNSLGGLVITSYPEVIYSGGRATGTTLHAGAQLLYGGAADATTINWIGYQEVYSGGIATGTTINGGTEVFSGVPLSEHGVQDVFEGGTAIGSIVNTDGELFVFTGGAATGATLNGGSATIVGTVSSTVVNQGGLLSVPGTAVETTVNRGGIFQLYGNGTAADTMINSGGLELVYAGTLGGVTTISGGILELHSAAIVNGAIDFASGNGELKFDDAVIPRVTINGFASLDKIELVANYLDSSENPQFDHGGALTVGPNNVLHVAENGNTYDLQFDPLQDFSGEAFQLVPDSDGVSIVLGEISNILLGQLVSGAVLGGGSIQTVYGTAHDTIVDAGGYQNVALGGTTTGTTVNNGGVEEVLPNGSDADATIDIGGTQIVLSGGETFAATISGGTQQVYGVARHTIANSGLMFVYFGGTAIDTILNNSGRELIEYGGTATGTLVNSGGLLNVEGGTASGVTINTGGIANVISGELSDPTIIGGTLILQSGAVLDGAIHVAGTGGTVEMFNADPTTTTALFDGSTLTVSTIEATFQFQIAGANGSTVTIQAGQFGGTDIVFQIQANQPPAIDVAHSTVTGTINERPNVTGSLALDIANGAIAFTDADLSDRPTASVTHQGLVYHDAHGNDVTAELSPAQMTACENAFLIVPESSNTNTGKIDWGFTAQDSVFDFLGVGEAVVVTSTVEIDDGHGGKVDQDVTVTINGADDLPIALRDLVTVQKGSLVSGNVLANDSDPDLHDTHDKLHVTKVTINGHEYSVGQSAIGTYGTLIWGADGNFRYFANQSLGSATKTGAVDTFTYTVNGGHVGDDAMATLTFVVQSTTGLGNPHTLQPSPVLVGYPIAANDQVIPHEITQGNRSDPSDTNNDHGTRLAPINNIPLQWAYDFRVAADKPVYAVAAGTVVYVYDGFTNGQSFDGYGNVITIKSSVNGETFYTTYAHLDGLNNLPPGTADPIKDLYVGESITAVQEIALSGSTGAPGAHLHIQFGTQTYQAYLDTTDAKTNKSDPIGTIADGSHDDVSPAYFQQIYIDFRTSLNSSDKIYDGTEGSDYFVANTNGDTIVTYGGADTIVLDAIGQSGRQSNHIGLYGGSSIVDGNHELQLAKTHGVVPGRAGSITDSNDFAQGGFWGLAGAVSEFGGLAPNTATSADMSVIKTFLAGATTGGDILDFSVGAWGSGGINAAGGINHGLTAGDLFTHPASSAIGIIAVTQLVQPGQTVLSATDIVELSGTFADANAAVAAIHSRSDSFQFAAALPNKDDAHMLVAYEDLSGNSHIMDVEFNNASGAATANSTILTEHASDMVELTGVSLSSLTSDHFHLLV